MNKLALITGASSGIGLELAKVMAQKGHDLLLVARSEQKLEEIARGLEKQHNVKVHTVSFDLSLEGSGEKLFDKLQPYNDKVEILVNNAGVGLSGPLIHQDMPRIRQTMTLNMDSLTELCRLYGAMMAARRYGAILNVASTAAYQAGPYMAVYYASKAFVLSFTEALRDELKPFNVQVSALCPGPTVTDFFNRAGLENSRLARMPWVMTGEEVARQAYIGLQKDRDIIIAGFTNSFGAIMTRFAPRSVTRWIAGRINKDHTVA